ncbi:MAG: DPP IV N-terminal domain-containing protein, partial [Anaerolineaceae bacterium]
MPNKKRSLTHADYARAEAFLPWNQNRRIFNSEVKPRYLGQPGQESEIFWYAVNGNLGRQFKRVDPLENTQEPLFDAARLAAALSEAGCETCTEHTLPFSTVDITEDGKIRFTAAETQWEWDAEIGQLVKVDEPVKRKPGELLSPDGKFAAFRREYNLWARNVETDEEFPLTRDGLKHYDYGASPESNTLAVSMRPFEVNIPPLAVWSPDSKKLLTQRLDQRKVKDLHLLQNCPPEGQRPVLHTYKYAMVGDENLTQEEIVILDVEARGMVAADCCPVDGEFMGAVELKFVWWGKDSSRAYYVFPSRDHKTMRFYEIDAQTGASRLLLEEQGKTYVELGPMLGATPNIRVIRGGQEFIWPSERSGWFNLYRYDAQAGE